MVSKIFITGVSGYIGHQLALKAVDLGFGVAALVRSPATSIVPRHPGLTVHQGDVTNYASVLAAMKDCDYVLHAAGLTQLWHKDKSLFERVNVQGTRNVLEAAQQTGVKKLVFTSSCAVLGPSALEPVKEDDTRVVPFENDYEITKHAAEVLVREFVANGLSAVILRPPRVFGPGLPTKGNPINRLIENTINRGIAFRPAVKNVIGNYAFINDVVDGHFLALQNGRAGEAYNVGGENFSYEMLFAAIAAAADKPIRTVAVPVALLRYWASLVFGANYLIGRHTHITPTVVNRLLQNRAVSCEKAIAELGYRITPFQDAMATTVRFLQHERLRP